MFTAQFVESRGEVGEPGQLAVLSEDQLVEVGGFVELPDGVEGAGGGGIEAEGGGKVNLGNPESGSTEGVEGFPAVVEFDREVAGVIVDTDTTAKEIGIHGLVEEALEEGQGLGGVFEVAQRFGFQAEVEVAAGLIGEILDVPGAGFEVRKDGGLVGLEVLEGAGKGGDRAFHPGRDEPGDDFEELGGVSQPLGSRPVGTVDILLHAGPVEGAVGEPVDGENVAVLPGEPRLEGGKVGVLEEFGGGEGGEAEADGIRSGGALGKRRHPVPDLEGVLPEDAERFLPGLGRVDVRAVGEVVIVVELHAGDRERSAPNFQHARAGFWHIAAGAQ